MCPTIPDNQQILKPKPKTRTMSLNDAQWFVNHYPWDTFDNMTKKLNRTESTIRRLAHEYKLNRIPIQLRDKVPKTYISNKPITAKKSISEKGQEIYQIISPVGDSFQIPAAQFEHIFIID